VGRIDPKALTVLERLGLREVSGTGATGDRAVHLVARRQFGLITAGQARALGLSPTSVKHRLTRCRWHRAHRGVYWVGEANRLQWSAEFAAVLAMGESALLARRSVLAAHRLITKRPVVPEVLVEGRNPKSRDDIAILRSAALDARDRRRLHGLPSCAPAIALLDAAADLHPRRFEQAVAAGYRGNVVRRSELEAVLERHPTRRGAAALHRLLADETGPVFTRSQLEELGLGIVRRAAFPHPEVNRRLGSHEVDLVWREQRFVLELDGHAFHSLRPDRERDYARDFDHQQAGFLVARATGRQARDEPERVIVMIARGLFR
jgi:hypothetical protein